MKLRTPIKYFGGKQSKIKHLLKCVPQHHTYVEVFGGSGALLFAKEPAPVEVYNDLNGTVVNFFRVLRDKDKADELYRRLKLTPYSRVECDVARSTMNNESKDDIYRAWALFVAIHQSFGGMMEKGGSGWSYSVTNSRRKMCGTVSKFQSATEILRLSSQRLAAMQIDSDDFRRVIPRYDRVNTFFYVDPPYIKETRGTGGGYRYEMDIEDHTALLDLICAAQGMILLSGYDHPLYLNRLTELNGWTSERFDTTSTATGCVKGQKDLDRSRTETLWMNAALTANLKNRQQNIFDIRKETA